MKLRSLADALAHVYGTNRKVVDSFEYHNIYQTLKNSAENMKR